MKKVVLLGDSIRLFGYGTKVTELLGEDYTVWQPSDNCRFAQYTLRGLFEWAGEIEGADIIHWNNGLWDICNLFGDGSFTDERTYVETMLRIAKILKSRANRVIFATSTPVLPANIYNKNEVIERYNTLIVPQLAEIGVEINDLYTLIMNDLYRYIDANDLIHLTPDGIDLCADAVVKCIKSTNENLKN